MLLEVVPRNKKWDWEGKIIQGCIIEQATSVVNKFDPAGTIQGAVQTRSRIVPKNERGKALAISDTSKAHTGYLHVCQPSVTVSEDL